MSLPLLLSLFVKGCADEYDFKTWKKANVNSVFKREDSGNSKPLSLTYVFQKLFQNKVIWSSQHGFLKGEPCLTNLRTFQDEVNKGEQWVLFFLTSAGVLPMYIHTYKYTYKMYINTWLRK